jgi:hypothetical protein
MDVNEWMSYECSFEGTHQWYASVVRILTTLITRQLVHIYLKKNIAVKIASVNGPSKVSMQLYLELFLFCNILLRLPYGISVQGYDGKRVFT